MPFNCYRVPYHLTVTESHAIQLLQSLPCHYIFKDNMTLTVVTAAFDSGAKFTPGLTGECRVRSSSWRQSSRWPGRVSGWCSPSLCIAHPVSLSTARQLQQSSYAPVCVFGGGWGPVSLTFSDLHQLMFCKLKVLTGFNPSQHCTLFSTPSQHCTLSSTSLAMEPDWLSSPLDEDEKNAGPVCLSHSK